MFSEAVDKALAMSGRPDKLAVAPDLLMDAIREVTDSRLYWRDRVEDLLTASGTPFIWNLPTSFRRMETVQYVDGGGVDGCGTFPKFHPPGRIQAQALQQKFYYGSGTSFVFSGVSTGMLIKVSYFAYVPYLDYYPVGSRPAVYNKATDSWTYLPEYDVDDETRYLARTLVTNWALLNFNGVFLNGLVAKILNGVDDQERGRIHYSLFQAGKTRIQQNEQSEAIS